MSGHAVQTDEPGIPELAENRRQARGHALVVAQVLEYLDGKRERFELPLDLRGTAFQLKVWRFLLGIELDHLLAAGRIERTPKGWTLA